MSNKLINKNLFIDRIIELEKICTGLKNGTDFVLIAPRRYGKTTLVNQAFSSISGNRDYLLLTIDIMRYSGSVRNLAMNITDKALGLLGLSGRLHSMISKVELSLKLKITWGDIELEPILSILRDKPSIEDDLRLLEYSLELLEKIAIKKNKVMIVFFDEFGELYHLGEMVIKLFRSVLQLHKHVSYIFAGSQETLMNHIFVDKSSAFYRFGTIIYLGVLEEREVIDYFSIAKFNIEISQSILTMLGCHPYYTSKAIQDLYNSPMLAKNNVNFIQYINQLLNDEHSYLDMLIQKINHKRFSLDVLSNIARGLPNNSGLEHKSRQYISNIISSLQKDGYIRNIHRGVYTLTDPLLKIYLSN